MNVLCAVVCAMFLALNAPAAADPGAQLLSIRVRGDGAEAKRLPHYAPDTPIAVDVRNSGSGRLDGIVVAAAGPDGGMVRVELTPLAGGTFAGRLVLPAEGTWHVRLTTRAGRVSTDTTPIALFVQAPEPTNAWLVGAGVGAALFVVVGGGGFFLLRRAQTPRPPFKHAA